jgi:hypothetical protein
MTTVHSAPPTVVSIGAEDGTREERWARRQRRRRLVREELLAVVVLVLALAATIAVLATQWLGSGPNASATGAATAPHVILGGPSMTHPATR